MTKKTKTLEAIRQAKRREIKTKIENIFYGLYPQYRQNNISIFGTEEERKDFKYFHDEVVKVYDELLRVLARAKTEEEINNISINFEVYNIDEEDNDKKD